MLGEYSAASIKRKMNEAIIPSGAILSGDISLIRDIISRRDLAP
jgi:hypothetical protein